MRNSPRKDRVATSSTPYTGPEILAIPLEVCVWDTDIFEDDPEAVLPVYWVIWDPEVAELQIADRPPQPSSKRKVHKSLKFEYLRGHKLQVCALSILCSSSISSYARISKGLR